LIKSSLGLDADPDEFNHGGGPLELIFNFVAVYDEVLLPDNLP
jgi:hypothetical protein